MDISKAMVCVCNEKDYRDKFYSGTCFRLINYRERQQFEEDCFNFYGLNYKYFNWENVPKTFIRVGEVAPCIFQLIHSTNKMDEDEKEAINLFLENYRNDPFIISYQTILDQFENSYVGKFATIQAFGQYHAEEYLAITPESSPNFNSIAHGRNLLKSIYYKINNHVFENTYIEY